MRSQNGYTDGRLVFEGFPCRNIEPRVLRTSSIGTRRFEQMLAAEYAADFDARVHHTTTPRMAFLTYDDEHHRFAFADLAVIAARAWHGTSEAGPGRASTMSPTPTRRSRTLFRELHALKVAAASRRTGASTTG